MSELELKFKECVEKVRASKTLPELEQIKAEVLGKSGFLTLEMGKIKDLPVEEKKSFGARVNQVKLEITEVIDSVREKLETESLNQKLQSERIDVTLPVTPLPKGSIHPINRAFEEAIAIFGAMGFSVVTGPEIEDDFHNFTALNTPETHPARAMHDTFYIEGDKLLRTQTSSVQIRYMTNNKPPYRIISPGRVYRCDYDATHTPMFNQLEVLCVDKGINMGHLKFTLSQFFSKFFEVDNVPIRLRPSFFPFTEPSAEVDVGYGKKDGAIKIGGGNEWLEILGCGMVHPNVLKNCGVDPNEYQGFALGMGMDRMAMLKYGIGDLRSFFEGDKRWFDYYNFSNFDIPNLIYGLS
ncbi:MAG: phenylalanine--tRNA ligase subunit alpha [Sphingobacteriia bacterium]|nr:phenylalanine--tRNA ligase subunit alpha [Sphingobacteriia bacterium]